MEKKTLVLLLGFIATLTATAQTAKSDSIKVADNHTVADCIQTDSLITKKDSVSIMFRRNQPMKSQKVKFKMKKHDPYKEKLKNLNIADGVRQIIR